MKTGIFCNYENHYQNHHRAISEQVALVKQAESLGFEEAWVTEHHFYDFSVSSSILMLLAHLAGITSTIRLGSAAVLLAFHNPILVAEGIATLDNLCDGRLAFGIARGGPFPEQNKHFSTAMSESRPKTIEALKLIERLLYENEVSFQGNFYQYDRVTIYPKPLQKKIPVFVATSDEEGISLAAQNSFGLMGGAPFSVEILKKNVTRYRAINNTGADELMLTRFFFVARTSQEAICEAKPFIRDFSQRMKGMAAKAQNNGNNSQHLQGQSCFEEDYLLENSIIGDVKTCKDRIKRFRDEIEPSTLALKPCSFELEKNLESMKLYNQEIQSYV